MTTSEFAHLAADLHGVPVEQLRDTALLGGLLIASASAAGFTAVAMPHISERPDGSIVAVLLLDGAHMSILARPDRELLLLDIVAAGSCDSRKALEVFARRLTPASIHSDTRPRG